MIGFKVSNKWKSKLYTDISTISQWYLDITPGTRDLFPEDYPFRLLVETKTWNYVETAEIVEVTGSPSTDRLTITRAIEPCPVSDSSLEAVQAPQIFKAGAQISLSITAGLYEDIRDGIIERMPILWGLWLYWPNTVKEIDPTTWEEELRSLTLWNSVQSSQLMRFIHPSTRAYTEVSFNDFTALLTPQSNIFTDEYILWENVSQGNALTLHSRNQLWVTTQSIWDKAATGVIWYPVISSGVSSNQIILNVASKTWSPANLNISIETDNAWVHSWTLINANASISIPQASISTGNNTITFPGSFSLWAIGTKVWVWISCSWNAANYYTINTVRWLSSWITFTNTTSNTSTGAWLNGIIFTVNKACYLSRIVMPSNITVIALRINWVSVPWFIDLDRLYNYLLVPWTTYTFEILISVGVTYFTSTGNLNKTDGNITVTADAITAITLISTTGTLPKFTSALVPMETIVKANAYSGYSSLVRWFAKTAKNAWEYPSIESWFVTSLIWLSVWESYIVSNTPGNITSWTSWIPFRVWVAKKTNLLDSAIQWNISPLRVQNNIVYAFHGWMIYGWWWASWNTALQWSRDWDTWQNISSVTGWVMPTGYFYLPRWFIQVVTNVDPNYII